MFKSYHNVFYLDPHAKEKKVKKDKQNKREVPEASEDDQLTEQVSIFSC